MTHSVRESASLFRSHPARGVEITHVPPSQIADLAKKCPFCRADIIVVMAIDRSQPVANWTSHAACGCKDANIFAHPVLITIEDALLAARNGVALEITSRGGHNPTNGHVVQVGREAACQSVVDSDRAFPPRPLDERAKFVVAKGAGLD